MKKLNTLDKILLLCYITIIIFTAIMVVIFCFKDNVPDSLVVAFFGIFVGETGCCTYIWNKKQKDEDKKTKDDDE